MAFVLALLALQLRDQQCMQPMVLCILVQACQVSLVSTMLTSLHEHAAVQNLCCCCQRSRQRTNMRQAAYYHHVPLSHAGTH